MWKRRKFGLLIWCVNLCIIILVLCSVWILFITLAYIQHKARYSIERWVWIRDVSQIRGTPIQLQFSFLWLVMWLVIEEVHILGSTFMLNLRSCNIFSKRNNSTSFSMCARKHKLLLDDEILVLLFHQKLYRYHMKDAMVFISAISFRPVICMEQCHTSQPWKRTVNLFWQALGPSIEYSFFTQALFC